ncbi:P-loop containing nucleoside triphosphate hydrolase [Diplogelasinospora grovesii]|uniref:P-loop containing nucleoside triphosphate hydrolase n=1 Tax=Diplogelasinospora grovesii TaxID=303347 RepID=A0AAN6MWX3_9PEZI|nr:P-loop containing nucleoside triphosphate hydrolase [Diplogelasinospora grovesii]
MDLLEKLQLPLARTASDARPVVVMTCGIAGSGKSTLSKLLAERERDIILDRPFYCKEDREYFRRVIAAIFFRPQSKEVIRERIQHRRQAGVNADSALEIAPEILDRYWEGFESPDGGGDS